MSGRREIAIGLGAYASYFTVRAIVWNERGRERADHNARTVASIERRLRLRRVGRTRAAAAVRLMGLHTAVYLVFGTIGWCAAGWALATDAAPAAMTVPWLIGFPALLTAANWFTAPKRVER
jgi:hypothetical protein